MSTTIQALTSWRSWHGPVSCFRWEERPRPWYWCVVAAWPGARWVLSVPVARRSADGPGSGSWGSGTRVPRWLGEPKARKVRSDEPPDEAGPSVGAEYPRWWFDAAEPEVALGRADLGLKPDGAGWCIRHIVVCLSSSSYTIISIFYFLCVTKCIDASIIRHYRAPHQ